MKGYSYYRLISKFCMYNMNDNQKLEKNFMRDYL